MEGSGKTSPPQGCNGEYYSRKDRFLQTQEVAPDQTPGKDSKDSAGLRRKLIQFYFEKAFQKFQLDVKYLDDIPNLWPLIYRGRLPKYQYTLQDLTTATTFLGFAYELSIVNSMRFIVWVFEHLKTHRIDLSKAAVQSDWGVEFVGPPNARKSSPFVQLIEQMGRSYPMRAAFKFF